jgi:hypothetical protein
MMPLMYAKAYLDIGRRNRALETGCTIDIERDDEAHDPQFQVEGVVDGDFASTCTALAYTCQLYTHMVHSHIATLLDWQACKPVGTTRASKVYLHSLIRSVRMILFGSISVEYCRSSGKSNVLEVWPAKLTFLREPVPKLAFVPGYVTSAVISLKSTLNQLGLATLPVSAGIGCADPESYVTQETGQDDAPDAQTDRDGEGISTSIDGVVADVDTVELETGWPDVLCCQLTARYMSSW